MGALIRARFGEDFGDRATAEKNLDLTGSEMPVVSWLPDTPITAAEEEGKR